MFNLKSLTFVFYIFCIPWPFLCHSGNLFLFNFENFKKYVLLKILLRYSKEIFKGTCMV
jgi:hypothetical protein